MKKTFQIKKLIFILFVSMLAFGYVLPFSASAQISAPNSSTDKEKARCDGFWSGFTVQKSTITQNRETEFSGSIVDGAPKICSASQALLFVMYAAFFLAGSVAVLFIIIGGFLYLTASGNEEQIEKGKKTLVNSIIGLVVILLSVMIVRIVTNALTGNLNSGSPTTTTGVNSSGGASNPTGAPGGTGGQTITPKAATAADLIQIKLPSTIPRNGTADISGAVLQEDADKLSQLCKNAATVNTQIFFSYTTPQGAGSNNLGFTRPRPLEGDAYPIRTSISGISFPSNVTEGTLIATACGEPKPIASQDFKILPGLGN